MRAAITAIGHAVPDRIVRNEDLAEYLDTSDEWIRSRTGIRERRIADGGGVSELIIPAAERCLAQRGISADTVDCIIVATITPDYVCPPTAALVHRGLGTVAAWGFDLSAACCGFTFALVTADALIRSGRARRLLLCAADRMSVLANPDDRTTRVLFGDAATALLLEPTAGDTGGILGSVCRIEGVDERVLCVPGGGSAAPMSVDAVRLGQQYLTQQGPTVFKAAVRGMVSITRELLDRHSLLPKDVRWFVPHQANQRIMDAVAKDLSIPEDRVMSNIERFGNTTAATIPLCLSEWQASGRLHRGDRVVVASFGAGFTMGAVYLEWTTEPTCAPSTGRDRVGLVRHGVMGATGQAPTPRVTA